MIVVDLPIRLFQSNDYVRTPHGVAKVIVNVIDRHEDNSVKSYHVRVKHKFSYSSNSANEPVDLDVFEGSVHQITDIEYDEV